MGGPESDVSRGGHGTSTEQSFCGLSDIASSSGYFSGASGGRALKKAAPDSLADSLFLDDIGSSSDDDSEWDEEEWPSGHALPLPLWGCERPELCFYSLEDYQKFLECIKEHLGDCISKLPYDTISTFVQFCLAFEKQEKDRSERPSSFEEFYKDYDLPILSGRNTCVGLSVDLLTRLSKLEKKYLGLKDCLYPVSCEEDLDDLDYYCAGSTPNVFRCEKEHVLVCARIRISGRLGVVLMDPGYHTASPITVMEDGLYPHTGPYNTTSGVTNKTNSYYFHESNPAYVIWQVIKESRAGTSSTVSAVHISKPFLSGMDIAERRNLVYPMKTLINRDRNGNLLSGLYFNLQPLDVAIATVFYTTADGEQVRHKIPMSHFQEWRGNLRHPSKVEGSDHLSSLFRHGTGRHVSLRDAWVSPMIARDTVALDVSEEQCRAWEEAVDRVAMDDGRLHEIYRVLQYLSYVLADSILLQKINNINQAIADNSQYN